MREFDMYFINNYQQYFFLNHIIIFIFMGIVLFSLLKNLQDINPIILLLLFLILLIVNYTNFFNYEYINYLLNIDFKKLNLNHFADKKMNIIPIIFMIILLVISILVSTYIDTKKSYKSKNFMIFIIYFIFGIGIMIFNTVQITNNMSKIENYLESKNSSFKKSNTFSQIISNSLFIALVFLLLGYSSSQGIDLDQIPFTCIFIFFLYYILVLIINISILKNKEETLSKNIYSFKNPQSNQFL